MQSNGKERKKNGGGRNKKGGQRPIERVTKGQQMREMILWRGRKKEREKRVRRGK